MSDFCEITVKDQLDIAWSEWFEGLTIVHNDKGETMLSGQIRDQTALFSIIAKIRDMGLFLISVKYTASEATQEHNKEIDASDDDS